MADFPSTQNVIIQQQNANDVPKGLNSAQKFAFEKNFAFWARRAGSILTADTVVFALIANDKFVKVSLNTIISHLRDLDLFDEAKTVCHLPNTSFNYVQFETEECAHDFTNRSNFIAQKRVKFVTGQERMRQCRIQIENFPPDLVESLLPDLLKEVGTVIKISPQSIPRTKERVCRIGRTFVDFLFHDSKSLTDLPYHVQLLGHKIFLYVPSRPRICFRCSSTLHVVANCNLRYCRSCHGLRALGHTCTLSYADRVAGPVSNWEERLALYHEDSLLTELASEDGGSSEPMFAAPSERHTEIAYTEPSAAEGLHTLPVDQGPESVPGDSVTIPSKDINGKTPKNTASVPNVMSEIELPSTAYSEVHANNAPTSALVNEEEYQKPVEPTEVQNKEGINPKSKSAVRGQAATNNASTGGEAASVPSRIASQPKSEREQANKRKTKPTGKYSALLSSFKTDDDRPVRTKKVKKAEVQSPTKQHSPPDSEKCSQQRTLQNTSSLRQRRKSLDSMDL